MNYKNCIHAKEVPGTNYHACRKDPKPVVKLNKTALRRKWISFPEKVNPVFVDSCSGYQERRNG